MRIEQLRHVVEIARCGSMRQAALNLYISQPNLSVSHTESRGRGRVSDIHPLFQRHATDKGRKGLC